jgi:hypothetical protein
MGAKPVVQGDTGWWQRGDEKFLSLATVFLRRGGAVAEVDKTLSNVPTAATIGDISRRAHAAGGVQALVLSEVGMVVVGKNPPDPGLVT